MIQTGETAYYEGREDEFILFDSNDKPITTTRENKILNFFYRFCFSKWMKKTHNFESFFDEKKKKLRKRK